MDESLDYTVPTNESLFPVEYKTSKATYTIRDDIKNNFDVFCAKERLNKSQTMQLLMDNFVNKNKDKETGIKKA